MHIDPERAPNKTDPDSVTLPAVLGHQLGEIINGKWSRAARRMEAEAAACFDASSRSSAMENRFADAFAVLVGELRLRARCCGNVVRAHRYSHPITYG